MNSFLENVSENFKRTFFFKKSAIQKTDRVEGLYIDVYFRTNISVALELISQQ